MSSPESSSDCGDEFGAHPAPHTAQGSDPRRQAAQAAAPSARNARRATTTEHPEHGVPESEEDSGGWPLLRRPAAFNNPAESLDFAKGVMADHAVSRTARREV
ncbi:MAG: hypothetical protein BroJett003_22530 [Planctomycetota bacterium]|nr:MAG: hypothetical protein BroJett003_22530 [Planctomycetota bacterium]